MPELEPGTWFAHDGTYAATSFRAMARRLPALAAQALRLAWQASPGDTAAAVGLQMAAGVLTGLGLLATTGVLQALFAAGPTPGRVRAAFPALALVAIATATRKGLGIAAGWAQARLSPLVDVVVEQRLFAATAQAELAAFDDPAFNDAMKRARDRGVMAAPQVVNATVDVITGTVGLAAAAGTLGVLHPVLLPLLVASALPEGWASVRAARTRYLARIAWIGVHRRKWMLSDLMANRNTAAEVRAYTAGGYLLHRYTEVARRAMAAELAVARAPSLARGGRAIPRGGATGLRYRDLRFPLVAGFRPPPLPRTPVCALP